VAHHATVVAHHATVVVPSKEPPMPDVTEDTAMARTPTSVQAEYATTPGGTSRQEIEDWLLPFQIALQIIEHRLDSIALESDLQPCNRMELSNTIQKEESCEALLAQLEGQLGMNKHHVRFSLQSILCKMDTHMKSMQYNAEPLLQKLETQLQTHHQSSKELVLANIEQKMEMSQTWRHVQFEFGCLIARYENRLQLEMNRGVEAAQTLSLVLQSAPNHQGSTEFAMGRASASSPWSPPQRLAEASLTASLPQVMRQPSPRGPSSPLTNAEGATGGTLE